MPLLNSMGIFRNMTAGVKVTHAVGDQWIAEFSTFDDRKNLLGVGTTGDVYAIDYASYGIFKITAAGTKVYSFYTSNRFSSGGRFVCMDSSDNVYVGGNDSTGWSVIIKYNSSGTILWQKYYKNGTSNEILSMVIAPTGDLFAITGNQSGNNPSFGSGPYIVLRIDNTTGAVINQRKVLKYATSAPSDLTIDNINNQLIITGTDYSGTNSSIINGYYNFTNTDTASSMTIQSSSTDSYNTFFGGQLVNNCVTDGSFIYMMGWRTISGITTSVVMKIDKVTGSVDYSNAIIISGNTTTITGITMDNSGYIYVNGYWAGPSGYTYVAKIEASTGNVVWCKTIGSSITTEGIGNIVWNNGFLYFVATYYTYPNNHVAIIKINSDGSLPDGTYGTYWSFTDVTPSLTAYIPETTGTTTGSNSTTSIASSTSSFTKTTDSTTISTTYIP